jgi:hypothetical protein
VVDWAEDGSVRDHDWEIIGLVLANLAAPLVVGLLAGRLVDWVGDRPWSPIAAAVQWTGIFEPPTAWEATWQLALVGEWAAVEITLKDGHEFHVLFDNGSRVGLSPGPRFLFFDTEYSWQGDNATVHKHEGIFIDATEVVSVRLEHIEW